MLGENGPLNLIRLDSSRVFLQSTLFDKGYADAEVDTAVAVDTVSRTAVVTFTLNPKYLTTVEDVVIDGNEGVSDKTIGKSLTFKVGDIFRRSEMLRSQRALYESNLFRRAAIEARPPIDIATPDSAKVVVVTLQESPPREARFSAGFNTIDFVQVEARFAHFNFFGSARRLEIQGAVGNLFAKSLNGRGIFHNASVPATSSLARYFVPTYNASIISHTAVVLVAAERAVPEPVLRTVAARRGFTSIAATARAPLSPATSPSVRRRASNYRFEISKVDAGDVYFCINYGVCDQPTLEALRGNQKLSPVHHYVVDRPYQRSVLSQQGFPREWERRKRVGVHGVGFPLQSRGHRWSSVLSGEAARRDRSACPHRLGQSARQRG